MQRLRRTLRRTGEGVIPSSLHGAPQDATESKETLERLKRMAGFESQDFDPEDHDIQREFALHRSEQDYAIADTWRWLLAMVIGAVMGVLAFVVDWAIEALNSSKFDAVRDSIRLNGTYLSPLLPWAGSSAGFALMAGGLVAFIEPLAAGSGIPEMKTYLNGVHIKGLMSIKTLFAKLTGIVFSISAGLIAGKEGPFVHGGGIVGGGIGGMGSQTLTQWLGKPFKAPRELGGQFRNAADHRDFTAIGTAAGVATAFAAPIGGLLFCIEEGVSFYSTSVFWRGFLATCIGVLTLHILADAKDYPGRLLSTKFGRYRDFGVYTDNYADLGVRMYYSLLDIPIFCIMGALGGLAGALFIKINVRVTQLRHRWLPRKSRWRRILEVLMLAFVTTTLWYTVAYASPCLPLPGEDDLKYLEVDDDDRGEGEMEDFFGGGGDERSGHFPRLWCPPGHFSAWGQLFMVPLSQSLRLILHLGEPLPKERPDWAMSVSGLLLFTVMTFAAMCVTNGVGASTGMFVPCLAVGAAGGRLFGQLVRSVGRSSTLSLHAYAVVGSAAFLGGATRMTLTTAVMVMETTGALQLIIPLMVAVFFSKIVGDRYGVGIDDTHVRLRGAPVLYEPGVSVEQQMIDDKLTVAELASTSIVALPPVVRLRDLIDTLRSCSHQAFPVTPEVEAAKEPGGSFELHGLILRSTLLCMLKLRLGGWEGSEYNAPTSQSQRVDLLDKLDQIPIKLRVREEQSVILDSLLTRSSAIDVSLDLRPFMQKAPFVVNENASLTRAYRLFRTMGLRHLFIAPENPRVVGIITRKDLIMDNAKLALGQKADDMSAGYEEERTFEVLPLLRNRLPFIPYSAYDSSMERIVV